MDIADCPIPPEGDPYYTKQVRLLHIDEEPFEITISNSEDRDLILSNIYAESASCFCLRVVRQSTPQKGDQEGESHRQGRGGQGNQGQTDGDEFSFAAPPPAFPQSNPFDKHETERATSSELERQQEEHLREEREHDESKFFRRINFGKQFGRLNRLNLSSDLAIHFNGTQ